MKNKFVVNKNTQVKTDFTNDVLRNAAGILNRDISKVVTKPVQKNFITLRLDNISSTDNNFKVRQLDETHAEISSGTELGVMYGVLAVSRKILGIPDFWFWLDKKPKRQSTIVWDNFNSLKLPNYHVKYRGWFVNDELLINDWQYNESNTYVWQIIFETLLRCGGNIVIPGTDTNSHLHRELASQMGLMIAHHHAEPLGAEMFARVYPDLEPSYLKYPGLFKHIWQVSIDKQKDSKVLWNLGFRGQGDRPFWADDPHEYTLEKKAAVINSVIKLQYEMVKKVDPNAMCSMNIYGELPALYNKGLLEIPKDVIQIWADNGYGKMISRRQGNDDPRSEVLKNGDPKLSQGIYYHVAFHDLQASNFLTLLQIEPHEVALELEKVRKATLDNMVMVNTGSIKPHIFFLWLLAQSWRTDFTVKSSREYLEDYVSKYYSNTNENIIDLYLKYFATVFNYRKYADQKAGDEFYTYTLRKLIKAWLTNADEMLDMTWLLSSNTLSEQVNEIDNLIKDHVEPFAELSKNCQILLQKLNEADCKQFYNDLWLGIVIHTKSIKALQLTIKAYKEYKAKKYLDAFLTIDEAKDNMEFIVSQWRNNPADKWRDFYQNDCYTNITLTASLLETLESFLRVCGDGPDQDQWERQYLMNKSDAQVMLLSNTHKAYSDRELANRLRGKN